MKKSNRILIAAILIEGLIAGIGAWLLLQMANGNLTPTTSVDETRTTIFSVLGGVMGVFGGILAVLWIVAKKRES